MPDHSPPGHHPPHQPAQGGAVEQDGGPTDDELDAWILARLEAVGVDLSVLPEEDEDAPADRRRILASARRFLRTTPGTIAAFELDPLGPPPGIYPAEMSAWTRE